MAWLPQASTDLDGLRRRLYGPDASATDLERYRVALAAATPATPAAEEEDVPARTVPPARAATHRRADWTPHAVLGGVVLLACLLALTPWSDDALPAASALSPAIRQDLTVPAPVRQRFVAALRAGTSPEVQPWLYDHPPLRPNSWFGVGRLQADEFVRTGSSTLRLRPSSFTAHGGRTTLVLVLDTGSSAAWSLTRGPGRGDADLLASGAMQPGPGVPGAITFEYAGKAPDALTVVVSDGVRWDAVVAYTD